MPMRGDKKAGGKANKSTPRKAASAKKAAPKKAAPAKKSAAGVRGESRPTPPRLVERGGIVYVKGCDVPVWRLEQARRAGSSAEALAQAFPGLSPEALDLAFSYARRHRAAFDRLIRKSGPAPVTTTDGPDDGAGFEQELGELLDHNAELYRRLAR
jgi:uncharacterized protein (DUF433 family)